MRGTWLALGLAAQGALVIPSRSYIPPEIGRETNRQFNKATAPSVSAPTGRTPTDQGYGGRPSTNQGYVKPTITDYGRSGVDQNYGRPDQSYGRIAPTDSDNGKYSARTPTYSAGSSSRDRYPPTPSLGRDRLSPGPVSPIYESPADPVGPIYDTSKSLRDSLPYESKSPFSPIPPSRLHVDRLSAPPSIPDRVVADNRDRLANRLPSYLDSGALPRPGYSDYGRSQPSSRYSPSAQYDGGYGRSDSRRLPYLGGFEYPYEEDPLQEWDE